MAAKAARQLVVNGMDPVQNKRVQASKQAASSAAAAIFRHGMLVKNAERKGRY
ncbi:MAG: hypothetical protein NTW90_02305 [Nitrosospira sp.]|nr:hypothetical protein [Nitrosospira sp.]